MDESGVYNNNENSNLNSERRSNRNYMDDPDSGKSVAFDDSEAEKSATSSSKTG